MKKTKVNPNRMALLIVIAIVLIVIIAIFVSSGKKEETDLPVENEAEQETIVVDGGKLAETKTYKGLEIKNAKFEVGKNQTKLIAEVVNNTGSDSESQYININVFDDEGNKIKSIGGSIDALKNGESKTIETNFLTTGKEVESYRVEITEIREEDEESKRIQEENIRRSEEENKTQEGESANQ